MANTYKMTDRDIRQLILLRASNSAIFTGRRNSAMRGWRAIKRELGLQGLLSARQLKKKWDNLKEKHRVIKNPSEGEKPWNPGSWRWFNLMEDALNGRLDSAAKILEPLPIDDEKQDVDLPLCPTSNSKEVFDGLHVVEMAPIEDEEDVEMIDTNGRYEVIKTTEESVGAVPKVNVKVLECAPALPETVPNTQPSVLYATLLPDSTASVARNCPTTTPNVMEAKTMTNTQPTLLYATLSPDSTATLAKNCSTTGRNIALDTTEVNKKLAELRREKQALEKEQAEFDKELIHLERDREQMNRDRRTLERDRLEIERDRAVLEKDRAALERDRAAVERDRLVLDRDRAFLDRDRALFERDRVLLDGTKEDFQRQKEKDGVSATDLDQTDVMKEKDDELLTKLLQRLTSDADQQETRQRFVSLVQKLVEKL